MTPILRVWSQCLGMASIVAVLGSCRGTEDHRLGTWVAERDTIGDTVIVRTVSGSVWGVPRAMREDLHIGVLEGREELMFGGIQELAVDAAGGIYVFDGKVPALRYFDSTGAYVRTVGGKGAGPGEYQDAVLGLAVRRDGRIVLRDPRNGRLTVYEPDGTPAMHWPVSSGLFTANAMVLDTADHAYLKILLSPPERNKPWRIGLLHLDDQGQLVDTIGDPVIAGAPEGTGGTFRPSVVWAWSPLGYMVVGVNDAYHFEVRPPNGPVTRIERTTPTVDVLPEEHAELEAVNEWYRKYQGQFMTSDIPPVPRTKPPYRGFLIGQDGRIWVRRHVTAEQSEVEALEATPDRPPSRSWIEPVVYDVFEPEGTYLGEVRIPKGTSLMLTRGETAWGTRTGESGEIYVVRLRIAPLEGDPSGG